MKDHREIGREIDLFAFSELSPGCPIWLPNGTTLLNVLQDKIRQQNKHFNYVEVRTPVLWRKELYQTSGHWDHYRENMFHVSTGEYQGSSQEDFGQDYVLKPMNCPGHMEIFRSKAWSVRDLPLRMADHGVLHRNESSGSLGGLTRCRGFCQDDAHIFIQPNQIAAEIVTLSQMIQKVYRKFDMPIRAVVSTRPDKFLGEAETWDVAEDGLRSALNASQQEFKESPGDGAFYGPKIDYYVTDNHGREWQTATIQLDFQLPQRFALEYTDHDGLKKTPVVIHRAIYGSFERFVGILLEHYNGDLPTWLAPVQYAILPITDRVNSYCQEISDSLKSRGLRPEVDFSNNRLQQKIAVAQSKHVPNMVVIGDKELQNDTVTVRDRSGKNETSYKKEFYIKAVMESDEDFL